MNLTDLSRPARRPGWPLLLAVATGAALAAYTGLRISGGAPRAETVLPLAAAGAAALTLLALTRFAVFVIVVLALRTTLDAAKLGGGLDVSREAMASDAPGWLDPGAILGVLFIGAGTAWLVAQRVRSDRRRPGSPYASIMLPAAAVALAGAAALSLVGARDPATAAGEVMRIAAIAVMLLVVERLVSEDPRLRSPLLIAVFASAVPPVVLTLYQVVTGDGLVDVHGTARAHGTFWHPNVLGVFCALLLVMAVALFQHVRGNVRVALGLLAAGLVCSLVASYGRGAWAAALAGLVVVALLQDRRLLPLLGGAVAGVLVAVPSAAARLAEPATSGASGTSLGWRFEQWAQALDLVGDNPVTGVGPGMVRGLLGREVHNDYLRALVETGLVGLLAYLALLAAFAMTAWQGLRTTTAWEGPRGTPARVERGTAVGFAGCTAAVVVFASADNVMTSVVVQWYLAAIAGLVLATVRTATAAVTATEVRR